MRRHLDMYVKREFKDLNPPRSNKRFFPRLKTIRSHMLEALKKQRYSKIDQECLCKKIENWKKEDPNCKIFFQPKGDPTTTYKSTSDSGELNHV